MNPLTLEIPKALVHIAGRTLLEWNIVNLSSAGCTDIVIATGWKHELIENAVTRLDSPSILHLVRVPEYERGPLQTFISAAKLTRGITVILNPVDLILPFETIRSVINNHPQDNPFAVTLTIDYTASTGSEVYVSSDDHIIVIRNGTTKPSRMARSALLLAFSSGFPTYCEDGLKNGSTNIFSMLNSLIERQNSVFAYSIDKQWFDIDTINDALKANRFLLESAIEPSSDSIFIPLGDSMEIGDSVLLESGTSIGKGTLLNGPCLIQRNSKIGEDCIIGPNVSLAESTLIGSNSNIRDASVFGTSEIGSHSKINNALVYQSKIFHEEV